MSAPNSNSPGEKAPEAPKKENIASSFEDACGFFGMARSAGRRHWLQTIVRFRGIEVDPNEDGESKRLAVQPRSKTWLIPPGGGPPQLLQPGIYRLGPLLIGGTHKDKSRGAGDRAKVYRSAVLCTVSELPVSATVCLPDNESMGMEAKGDEEAPATELTVEKALSTLSLRTSDDLLGGVRLQLDLKVDDPMVLIKAIGQEQVEDHGKVTPVEQDPEESKKKGLWQRLSLWLGASGTPEEQFDVDVPPFTVADLYWRIRLELATCIRVSVRRFTAQDLYEDMQPRSEVELDIQKVMGTTLGAYGIRVDRVSAFQFICPSYEKLLKDRAEVSIAAQGIDDLRKRKETDRTKKEIDTDYSRFETAKDAETFRHKLGEEAATEVVLDQNLAEQEERKRQRDKAQKEHQRQQFGADGRLKTDLEREKLQMLLELRNQALDADVNRRERMIEAEEERKRKKLAFFMDVPPDRLLELAMIENPQLVKAFAAAQNAKASGDRVKAEKDFRTEITGIFGANSEHTQKLLLEAARQIGRVWQQKARGDRPALPGEAGESGGEATPKGDQP
jgi:hypothetical protein